MGGAGPPGGYTQSPGGFGSPAGGQAEKKQVGRAGAVGQGPGPRPALTAPPPLAAEPLAEHRALHRVAAAGGRAG